MRRECETCIHAKDTGIDGLVDCETDGRSRDWNMVCGLYQVKPEEKISIEFTGEQFGFIMKYMDYVDAKTVQDAVMNAVSLAFDDADK